jgi:hypothetical protein
MLKVRLFIKQKVNVVQNNEEHAIAETRAYRIPWIKQSMKILYHFFSEHFLLRYEQETL